MRFFSEKIDQRNKVRIMTPLLRFFLRVFSPTGILNLFIHPNWRLSEDLDLFSDSTLCEFSSNRTNPFRFLYGQLLVIFLAVSINTRNNCQMYHTRRQLRNVILGVLESSCHQLFNVALFINRIFRVTFEKPILM